MSRLPESWMMSSNGKILNITITQFLRSWMDKRGMIGPWSQDPGLVSKQITNIENIIIGISIINNLVLPSGRGVYV